MSTTQKQPRGCANSSAASLSRTVLSMRGQSPKSMHGTCRDILNAISSLASEAGALLSNSPDGPQTDLFGPALAPANHSAPQEKDLPKPTSAISGPPSSISSASAALSMSLGSRLQARLGTAGSMEYRQTWKQKATPAGRPYWAHTAKLLPTSVSDFSGLPTPTVNVILEKHDPKLDGRVRFLPSGRVRKSSRKGKEGSMNWSQDVLLRGYLPTPMLMGFCMGFPPEWCACADTAMQSFPKSRRSSSKHTTK